MWSFEQSDRRPEKRGPCSSTVLPQQPARRRTMEELWKDISLNAPSSALDQHGLYRRGHRPADSSSPPFPNMTLQDFLAGPLNRPPHPSPAAAEELPFPPPPQAALSLSSGLEFQFLGGEPDQAKTHSNSSSNNVAGDGSFISSCSRKRSTESPGAADRYQKRMIKNRESAARSRARKQAYTIELELEISHLKEENAELQRQNAELLRNQVVPATKSTLQRSSTAPF